MAIRSPLLPERHPTTDFFVCDVLDAVPKGDLASMEHPIFSLSTKPDTRLRRYEQGDQFVEVTPSVKGLATVHDRDILIYCISQIIRAINDGRDVNRTIRLKAYDLLTATNRMTNGQAYEGLKAALERLRGTTISTNIKTGGTEAFDVFGLIERARIVREETRDGRMQELEIVLSDWVFNAIEAREVLTLHRDYFRLRKPLERWMYELGRKHCGHQSEWSIGLEKLKEKCGSNSTLKEFRRLVKSVVQQDAAHSHMPDYAVRLVERPNDVEKVVFTNRQTMDSRNESTVLPPPLAGETLEAARQIAPGWDVHAIEQDWRTWCRDKDCVPQYPAQHFLKFCLTWAGRRGTA